MAFIEQIPFLVVVTSIYGVGVVVTSIYGLGVVVTSKYGVDDKPAVSIVVEGGVAVM